MVDTRRVRGERGQGSLEYLSMTLVACVMSIAVVLAFTGGGFGPLLKVTICKLTAALDVGGSTGCTSDGKPVEYKPDLSKCLITIEEDTANGEVKILFFTIGENMTFKETHFKDGHIELTYVGGSSVGVEGGLGAEIRAGDFKIGAKADASAELGLKVGDTYVFANQEDADELRDEIDSYQAQMMAIRLSPDPVFFFPDPPRDPDKTAATVEFNVGVEGTLGLGIKDRNAGRHSADPFFNPNVNVKLGVDGSSSATVTTNHKTGDQIYTYSLKGSYSGSASWVIGKDGQMHEMTGTLALTYNKDGELVGVTTTTIRKTEDTSSVGGTTPYPGSEKANAAIKNGTAVYQTDQVFLTVNDDNREIVEGAVGNVAGGGDILWDATTGSIMPGSVDANSTDFQRLLYNEAQGLSQYYTTTTDGGGFGVEAKVGIQLGFSADWASSDTDLLDASYLGPPGPGGVRATTPFPECTR